MVLLSAMFNVYNVTVQEDKEKEKLYNAENLIRFDKNGLEVDPFNLWFGERCL